MSFRRPGDIQPTGPTERTPAPGQDVSNPGVDRLLDGDEAPLPDRRLPEEDGAPGGGGGSAAAAGTVTDTATGRSTMSIELTSPAFDDGGTIPERYSRLGDNVSPPLEWSGVPEGTVELALLVQDPDAPSGTFTHWIVGRLSPGLDRLEEGQLPGGAVEGSNDFGEDGYGGPQPPPGDPSHRYVFTLLALGEPSDLVGGASAQDFHDAVQGKELAQGQVTGRYGRS